VADANYWRNDSFIADSPGLLPDVNSFFFFFFNYYYLLLPFHVSPTADGVRVFIPVQQQDSFRLVPCLDGNASRDKRRNEGDDGEPHLTSTIQPINKNPIGSRTTFNSVYMLRSPRAAWNEKPLNLSSAHSDRVVTTSLTRSIIIASHQLSLSAYICVVQPAGYTRREVTAMRNLSLFSFGGDAHRSDDLL